MSLWIKVCGNTSLADAQLAVDAGADAVGFVFAPSPRCVTPEQVSRITLHLPAHVEKIGVFVDADIATIAATVKLANLSGVQLHFSLDASNSELSAQLRQQFGPSLRLLQVIHFGEEARAQLQAVGADLNIDGVLVDSRTATAVGGTGIPFDWNSARATVFTEDRRLRLIAAGGLNPANVAEAIATLHPWGVDVVSGVESAPGHKDAAKVTSFIANARSAAR
ncbi:phosphoribosylanthranilate isomerase [Acidicapsa ligni]|uniref:phosphoribosylanthranilate isomerase n=1 Tax=Acidicapsa ligni TaxID=542300 RepID=UPI0021DFF6F6|nr:phosphoribosylanthranilate isomerase [Acidicapsa ligni]